MTLRLSSRNWSTREITHRLKLAQVFLWAVIGFDAAIAKAANPLALAEEMIAAVRKAYDERQGK